MTRNEYKAACAARDAMIVEALKAGASYSKLGAEYQLTRARIAQIAKAAGIVRRPKAAA